jgi:hypothetical protein
MRFYTLTVSFSEYKTANSSGGEEKVKTSEWVFTIPSPGSLLPKVSTLKHINQVLFLLWTLQRLFDGSV